MRILSLNRTSCRTVGGHYMERKFGVKKKNLYFIFFSLSLFIITLFFGNVGVEAAEVNKHVLYISSYNGNFESVPQQIEGIQSVLFEHNIHLDLEYMDTKRFDSKDNERIFYNMLKYKIDYLPSYDAIIVGDDAALQFAMDYQNDLFAGIPIAFLGVNNFERVELAIKSGYITGIIEEMSLKDNILIAKKFNPKATKVVAIVDNTLTGIGDKEQFYQNEEEFEDLEFDDINVSEYTFQESESVFEGIGEDTILLYLSMYTDKTGQSITIKEATKLLREHTNVPIYRAEVGGVGDGILGGKMVSYKESGEIAANMILDVLNGTMIESISVIRESPNRYIFDYELIQKYGFDEDAIPTDAILINKESSFYEENKQLVVTTLVIIIILVLFSILLVVENMKQRATEKALKESYDTLTATNEELSATEEEIRAQYSTIQEHADKIEILNHKNEYLACHDYLTNLPNRFNFMKMLNDKINHGEDGTIMLLDLDNFKQINDILGHTYGDLLLKEVADRLSSIKDDTVIVSRFGGDEFLILKTDIDKNGIEKYLEKLRESFQKSFVLGNNENHVQFSIGISQYPIDSNNANQLIMNADTAMYKVKQKGKNSYLYYQIEMQEELWNKAEIELVLRNAIRNDGFVLHYQPQVSVTKGDIVSFEALLRLKNSKLSPASFISIAEETGFIIEIGRWVTKEAIEQIAKWKADGLKLKTVSINFSCKQLNDKGYLDFLKETLLKNEVEPKYIEIEITESIVLEEKENTLEFLNNLIELGVNIALDDFGTGYSSLNYLTFIPVNKVKLDKSLSDKFLESDNIQVMRSIISLAHSLKLEITAEGVETYEQYERLKEGGCDYIQGYLFSKPLGVKEIEKIYSNNMLEKFSTT